MADALSERERQLLVLASQGLTDHAIAQRLGISLATVGTYWGRVRIKFGPLNRTELVAVYLREQASNALERLRDENRKLQEEITEHARTSKMLQTSLDLFKGLVETAPDAILMVDQQGIIQLANERCEELFGWTSHELVGLHISRLVPERYREVHVEHQMDYNANPVRRRMGEHLATLALRKDGSEFRMATALSAVDTPTGLLITCIVRDLSEEHEKVLAGIGAPEEN